MFTFPLRCVLCVCMHNATTVQNTIPNRDVSKRKKQHFKSRKTAVSVTHIDTEGRQVVRVEEVVCDWLNQVEWQLDEFEGGAGISRGEDDAPSVFQHRDVSCQYHLWIKNECSLHFSLGFLWKPGPLVSVSLHSLKYDQKI